MIINRGFGIFLKGAENCLKQWNKGKIKKWERKKERDRKEGRKE